MPPARRRLQRTSAACDFCRKRKLGCDNAKPRCENCDVRDVQCIYSERTRQERPSNARIQKLEEEIIRLRELLETGHPTEIISLSSHVRTEEAEDTEEQRSTTTVNVTHTEVSTPTRDGSPFHGPSSAMFEPRCKGCILCQGPDVAIVSDNSVKNQLIADTTRQRQLENVHLRGNKLDFDGLDTSLGMELLANFWNRQYDSGSIVYRPVFMRDMAEGGPYFSKLLLQAMLFSGSKYLDETSAQKHGVQLDPLGRQLRRKFEQELLGYSNNGGFTVFQTEITTIQALLIVADALFSWCDERSLSWHYASTAISMLIDLGIHMEAGPSTASQSPPPQPEDSEVKRRLFWSAFVLDKVHAGYQGRPARLREADNAVPILFQDDYEELEPFHTRTFAPGPKLLSDSPTYGVSSFSQLCRLSVVMDRILSTLYAPRFCLRPLDQVLQAALSLHHDLEHWRSNLPHHLAIDLDNPTTSTILPHTLNLLAMYNSLVILLHRPFVSDGHLQSRSAQTARIAFGHCANAAIEIHRLLLLYQLHFCLKSVPYFVSYATYVSATIHVRMAAQQNYIHPANPNSEAHKRLHNCLYVLAVHTIVCRAPAQTLRILLALADRLKVHVNQKDFAIPIDSVSCRGTDPGVPGSGLATIPQSEFTAATSSSSAVAAPPQLPLPQPEALYQGNDTQTSLFDDVHLQSSDMDAILAGFDMDEIFRSFHYGDVMPPVSNNYEDGTAEDFFPDSLIGFDFGMP